MAYKLNSRAHYRAICTDMSDALFLACWRQYRAWLKGAIDDPDSDEDVLGWIDSIAAEKVNSAYSSFYIYG